MSEKQEYLNLARRSLLSGLSTAAAGGLIASTTAAVNAAPAQEVRAPVPSILVFDINETTLDIEYTAPVFEPGVR
jgi:2-haloacid dehalogenase